MNTLARLGAKGPGLLVPRDEHFGPAGGQQEQHCCHYWQAAGVLSWAHIVMSSTEVRANFDLACQLYYSTLGCWGICRGAGGGQEVGVWGGGGGG